ncbi:MULTISPECIES: hydantoinase/oxoprolinase family protein [Pseudomonadota]|uniref:5-oxoprolinase n=1 Tax=Stutzerimonas degradans TaxID=2968968 RepID=A0A8E2QE45_9GAMM|nr:hydantoinase/oxoprolinase family protein [Stutzerimonas degradans]MCF6754297.1 hydantoinase/oxoprolinase family protein [Stutzerimonas stutzeri]MCQ4276019.1 hydantoinase/oxoprolinase family protein [Stutzerimonas degradans]PNF76429.1 5-oxoprolinase [Stutzerimonas degradans]QPT22802.1 hydantoinase/oxoprolinase family protein [Stutzerimonas degradans]
MSFRLGVDVGGTFTDLLLINDVTGESFTAKVPSTPHNPSVAVLNGIERICGIAAIDAAQINCVMHGTTVATNAILTRRGAKVGLVTTRGYKQVLHIARSFVPGGLGGWVIWNKGELLAPLELTIEADERMGADGSVVRPLDREAIRQELARLAAAGIEALTISLVNAYVNGEHEREIMAIASEVMPHIPVSLSSEVVPEMQEYERTETTVVNSYVRPEVERYIGHLQNELDRRIGGHAQLSILRSDGGLATSQSAANTPVNLLLSGPAGGVAGAIWFCSRGGFDRVLTFDVGGTSTDVALIDGNQARIRRETRVGDVAVRAPSVDVRTVGAGGGSIASVPELTRALRVGPESAGAVPGPAAYDRGGEQATVTDANVVLGYLPAVQKLGGDFQIRHDLATAAVQRVADAMGVSLFEAAEGIVRLANEHMYGALRLISVEQGYDPRDFALCGFGGAGPLHANAMGILMNAWPVIIPPGPGVLCAYGDATTRVKDEASRSIIRRLSELDLDEVMQTLDQLSSQVSQSLASQGVEPHLQQLNYQADVRYQGQALQLTLEVDRERLASEGLQVITGAFDAEHEQLFSFSLGDSHELINLRAIARAPRPQITERQYEGSAPDLAAAVSGQSPIYYAGNNYSATLYDRARLAPGLVVTGPAIVMEMDSTTVVFPGYEAAVDRVGNLLIRPQE